VTRDPTRTPSACWECASVAARLGGTIRIQTAPNQGFALTVALPLAAIETREGGATPAGVNANTHDD